MDLLLFKLALFLILLATGGFIVFIVKQKKPVFKWSNRILIAGFIFHTAFLAHPLKLWKCSLLSNELVVSKSMAPKTPTALQYNLLSGC